MCPEGCRFRPFLRASLPFCRRGKRIQSGGHVHFETERCHGAADHLHGGFPIEKQIRKTSDRREQLFPCRVGVCKQLPTPIRECDPVPIRVEIPHEIHVPVAEIRPPAVQIPRFGVRGKAVRLPVRERCQTRVDHAAEIAAVVAPVFYGAEGEDQPDRGGFRQGVRIRDEYRDPMAAQRFVENPVPERDVPCGDRNIPVPRTACHQLLHDRRDRLCLLISIRTPCHRDLSVRGTAGQRRMRIQPFCNGGQPRRVVAVIRLAGKPRDRLPTLRRKPFHLRKVLANVDKRDLSGIRARTGKGQIHLGGGREYGAQDPLFGNGDGVEGIHKDGFPGEIRLLGDRAAEDLHHILPVAVFRVQNLLICRIDEGNVRKSGGKLGAFRIGCQDLRRVTCHSGGHAVLLELRNGRAEKGQVFVLSAAGHVSVCRERIVHGQKGLPAVVDLWSCQSAVEPKNGVRQPRKVGQLQLQPGGRRQMRGKITLPQHRLLLRNKKYAVHAAGQRVGEQRSDGMALSGARQSGDKSDHRWSTSFWYRSFSYDYSTSVPDSQCFLRESSFFLPRNQIFQTQNQIFRRET